MNSNDLDKYFVPENEVPSCFSDACNDLLSPSRRFRLQIRHYKTKEGCWHYSRGTVYRVSDNELVCDIKRNYSSFTHSFVTKNNQEWLITGRSYMSQTFVNLDTGQIFEPPGDQYDAYAFCWISATLLTPGILVVAGCHWACPEEFRFYDFSDPSKGWPEIKVQPSEDGLDADYKWPTVNADGTITGYRTHEYFIPLQKKEYDITEEELDANKEAFDNPVNWERVEDERITLKREGDHFIVVDRWVSPAEQACRARAEKARSEREEWIKNFKATDPLYLTYKELVAGFQAEKYESTGITYGGWCPDFDKKEMRWCRRIVTKEGVIGYTVDLEWAVLTGPIKLVIYKDGNRLEDKFFEHSISGMEQAFAYAKNLGS